jgi:hypothetical protein
MTLGQMGFLTNAVEALATAVGAGMLLGSFGVGALGLLTGKPRQDLERRVLTTATTAGFWGPCWLPPT